MLRAAFALGALLIAASPALAQDEPAQALAPAEIPSDAILQAQAAAARGDAAEALSRYLRVLSSRPDDPIALAGAGRAALDVGDVNAAAGFFARADARNPRNGQVKAGLARVLLQRGDARGALRYFREATGLGVAVADIASDRGLAYDLRGDPRRAQADYAVAIAARNDPETTRRLALSQAIAGDRTAAMATLDPLLRRQDVPAWRTRALVLALTGDAADALTGAALVMRRDQVEALAPYLPKLAALKTPDKAAAVHLGRFPDDATAPVRTAAVSTPPPVATAAASPALALPASVPAGETEARDRALAGALATARAQVGNNAAARSRAERIALADAAETQAARALPRPEATVAAPPSTAVRAPTSAAPVVAEAAPPPAETRLAAAKAVPSPSARRDVPAAASIAAPAAEKVPTIKPAPEAKPGPTRAERLAEERARKAEEAAKKKAEEKRLADAEARKAKAREPARHWVQVAGGANKADLGRAWNDLKAKWPKQLAGRSPWTTHYRFTNRLLIGPFATSDAAQDWVSERKKEGFGTFRVETNAGDPVERVKS